MRLIIDDKLKSKFPDLNVVTGVLRGVKVEERNSELETFKNEIINDVRQAYDLATLKDVPIFRTYRDFFWKIGIDPTKIRPAGEALIRRILQDKPIPTINTFVDAYNLASIKSKIAIGCFDKDKIQGELLQLRFAVSNAKFLGIGMKAPITLNGNEIVLTDEEKLIAIYPYRDSDTTKITMDTTNVVIVICGVPGIEHEMLSNAFKITIDYVTKLCNDKLVER